MRKPGPLWPSTSRSAARFVSQYGERIGARSDLAVFSFYATKNITTAEGGLITTSHADWSGPAGREVIDRLSRGFARLENVDPGTVRRMVRRLVGGDDRAAGSA